ncbi:sensor histidine kinase [Chitinophaga solisilvae]|uniref:HAMP domain-containing histidine kinase n=1 Tax=Chitinophaga solisilvae TaxID=1233460 RepID=A0A433WDI8_9BACT|nr:HAMP domain-containing histidine kinase [Chitinophaga solisilvae]NSL88500.1 HAMP domain-containing histidine kinase [Chitinophaga solisilvae]
MIKAYIHTRYIAVFLTAWLLVFQDTTAQIRRTPQLPLLQAQLAQQQDSAGYVAVLGKIAALYAVISLDSCFKYSLQVRDISMRQHNAKGLADANDLISFYYALKTDFTIAGIYGYKALQLHQQLGDSARMAKTLSNIYLFYRNLGRAGDANNYFYRAFHLAARLPPEQDSVYGILLVNYVMRFYKDSTRADSVQWAIKEGRRVAEKYPFNKQIFYVEAYDADNLVRQGRGREAEEKMYYLADIALQRGMPYVAMDMYGKLDDFQRLGYFADSTRYQERAYQLGIQTGSIELNLYWVARLYDYYRKHRQPDKVVYYSNEIMRLAAQSRYQAASRDINYIGFFLKEQALQSLAMKNSVRQQLLEKAQAENKNKGLLTIGLFTVTALLLLLLLSHYWHYRRKRQQERAMEKSYDAIAATNAALVENDEFKNKLLTILANDFRAPLHHIVEVAAQLKTGMLAQSEVVTLLKQIAGASRKTLDAFDTILKWIRLQLSGFAYKAVPCLLPAAVISALEIHKADIQEKGLTVINRIPAGLEVPADEEMLRVVNVLLLQVAIITAAPGSLLIISSQKKYEKTIVNIIINAGERVGEKLLVLQQWEENTFALGLVISRDFIHKMDGTFHMEEQVEKYLIFEYCL